MSPLEMQIEKQSSQEGEPLCQPDECKSCGACCGLYNYRDNSRATLSERLHRRTECFTALRGDPELYRHKVTAFEETKLYEIIYNCEFLGFIDGDHRRVGCLLHPDVNEGRDLRGISFYGEELCRQHLCPSHEKLTTAEKEVVIRLLDDWYLYGLCITDIDLIKLYLFHIQNAIGEEFDSERLNNPQLKREIREFLLWKEHWPFRRKEALRFGKYYFLEGEYNIARIDYEKLGCALSPYDGIFLSLASEFWDRAEVSAAEELVCKNIEAVIALYIKGEQ